MKRIVFPTLEEALFLHTELISRFGGDTGILDLGLLESALARPKSGFYKSLLEQAAALMQSLARNHCFVDGNKRMAFALPAVFLILNGYRLSVPANTAEKFLVKTIILGKAAVPAISKWLEKYVIEL